MLKGRQQILVYLCHSLRLFGQSIAKCMVAKLYVHLVLAYPSQLASKEQAVQGCAVLGVEQNELVHHQDCCLVPQHVGLLAFASGANLPPYSELYG